MSFLTRKTGSVALGVALFALLARSQQLEVTLTLAYNVYITGESVLVQIEALNATRDLIEIGKPGTKDAVIIEITKGGRYNDITPFNTAPLIGAFELKPGQSFQQKVELDKWFPLVEEGKYVAQLVVVHDGMRYESAKRSFDIVPGIPVKEGVQMFVSRQDQKRIFKLVHWNRNQTDRLFLRIEDNPGNKVWDSIDLGVLLQTFDPKIDISPEGEVTVVHRSTRDAFVRTLIWSLPDNVEVVERNQLLDPEISSSQRMRSLYGEMADDANKAKKDEKKSWWKFW